MGTLFRNKLLRICAETYKPYSQQKTRFYAGLCAFSGRLQIVLEALLFSNTKTGKNPRQQILAGEFPGDFSQRVLRLA